MSSRYRSRLSTHAALAALSVLVTQASAQSNDRFTYTINTQYKASGLSALGDGAIGTIDTPLIGPTIALDKAYGSKASIDIPAINWGLFMTPAAHLGYLGAEAKVILNGKAGIQVTPRYSGGLLDYTYNALVTLDMPRYPAAGKSVTINFSTGAAYCNLHTTAPTFGATFEAVADIKGSIDGSAYFFSDKPFASGYHAFNASAPNQLIGDFDITDGGAQKLADKLNYQAGLVNPTPIGVSGYIPVLTAGPASVDGSGTVNARGFAKFLSLDTSLMDLMLAFIPDGAAKKALEITQGDYMIAGTNYEVNWAICKTAANMDVGLDGFYSLAPINKSVTLAIKDVNGNVVVPTSSTDHSVTFTMPSGGISVTPTLTQDFHFTNRVGVNIQGSIGFYPFSGGAKGNLSDSLSSSTGVDFQFDVAPLVKKFDPDDAASSQIFKKEFDLPKRDDRSRTLAAVGLNTYSETDLPNELLFAEGPRIANLHAYGHGDAGDKDYLLLDIQPEQGRQFFLNADDVNSGRVYASMLFPDGVRLLVTKTFDGQNGGLSFDSTNGSHVVLRVPLSLANFAFARGIYSMTLKIDTKNARGAAVSKTYRFPLQAYARTPLLSGQFNTRPDLDTQGNTFRVTPLTTDADGNPATLATTQNLYFNSRFVLKDTVMTIDNPNDPDNPYVLPVYGVGNAGSLAPLQDSGVKADQVCAISLSNALVQELGGAIHSMRLRTPGTGSRSDGTPYDNALSDPTPLFFIAGKPNVYSSMVDAGASFGSGSFWIGLTGSNFAQATDAYLTGPQGTVHVPVGYGSPSSMRVQVPNDFIDAMHKAGTVNYSLKLRTPPFTTPSNDTAGVYPSGGDSNVLNFRLAYPTPSVASLSQPKIQRGVPSLKMRVTGSNLFKYSAGNKATTFAVDGKTVSPNAVVYPTGAGITVPYVEFPIDPSILAKNGTYTVTANNGGVRSVGTNFTVENGAPVLKDLSRSRFRVGPEFSYTADLTGAPFYKETQFLLNGSKLSVAGLTVSKATLTLDYSLLSGIAADSVSLTAFTPTPGGGTSKALPVALEEGDARTVKVVPGALFYDRLSNTYRQSIAVTYLGSRDVSRGVYVAFPNLGSGVTLQNATGNAGGSLPYIATQLAPNRPVTFVAVWKKDAGSTIVSNPAPSFVLMPD